MNHRRVIALAAVALCLLTLWLSLPALARAQATRVAESDAHLTQRFLPPGYQVRPGTVAVRRTGLLGFSIEVDYELFASSSADRVEQRPSLSYRFPDSSNRGNPTVWPSRFAASLDRLSRDKREALLAMVRSANGALVRNAFTVDADEETRDLGDGGATAQQAMSVGLRKGVAPSDLLIVEWEHDGERTISAFVWNAKGLRWRPFHVEG